MRLELNLTMNLIGNYQNMKMHYDLPTPISLTEEELDRFYVLYEKDVRELTKEEDSELMRFFRKDLECIKQNTLDPIY